MSDDKFPLLSRHEKAVLVELQDDLHPSVILPDASVTSDMGAHFARLRNLQLMDIDRHDVACRRLGCYSTLWNWKLEESIRRMDDEQD